jgi:hypothetical protein
MYHHVTQKVCIPFHVAVSKGGFQRLSLELYDGSCLPLCLPLWLGLNPTIVVKNLFLFFDCKYFNGLLSGVLVLTQHHNAKYFVSSRPSDERHRYYGMGMLRYRQHASNVAV